MLRESGGRARSILARLRATLPGLMVVCLLAANGTAEGGEGRSSETDSTSRPRSARLPTAEAPFATAGDAAHAISLKLSSSTITGAGAISTSQLRRRLSTLPDRPDGLVRRLVAIPRCDGTRIDTVRLLGHNLDVVLKGTDATRLVWIERTAWIRDQLVALVAIDLAAAEASAGTTGPDFSIQFTLVPENPRGPASRNAGPFTRVCERTVLNYSPADDEAAEWSPPSPWSRESRQGLVAYCRSVEECADLGADVLFLVAEQLGSSPAIFAFATHHADYLGLNVAIVSTSSLPDLTPDAIQAFIQDLYDSQSAEHFRDGHLGFVLLIGDAYADDNETVMIPAYGGYGGTEVASDHYYACVSGDDDFEDVMLGRFSVGNLLELAAALSKSAAYEPMTPEEEWYKRVLLVAGLFYTVKDDYVALFDEYDELIPDEYQVDRIYRHDFGTDEACALEVVSSFNNGYLLVNYAGDGWISTWDHTMSTAHIELMDNAERLPIVLSMACMTGWFDNTTEVDADGSYDCLAEQLVNSPSRGAVACLAAPRASDGGIFRTITKKLYQAIFEENCIFIGEMMAVAKLLHLEDEGDVAYARHFNLFGDPTLIFAWDAPPEGQPDLALKPHEATWTPADPSVGDDVTVSVTVHNQSKDAADAVLVRLSVSSLHGSEDYDAVIPHIDPWATVPVDFLMASPPAGQHDIDIAVDPDGSIAEIDETNNTISDWFYVYPGLEGFPVELGQNIGAPCLAYLDGHGTEILVPDETGGLWAIAPDGSVTWQSSPSAGPVDYGPEIAAASGDLDGDGAPEVIGLKRMGVIVVDGNGEEVWVANTDDPVGYPALADADRDGDLDVIVSTRGFFGGPSHITALDEDGDEIWSVAVPEDKDVTTCPAVGDFDLDGNVDVAYGTSLGTVTAFSCAVPPAPLWGPLQLCDGRISSLALADTDGDGWLEVVVGGEKLYVLNSEDGSLSSGGLELGGDIVSLAAGDTDGDGYPEVIAGTSAATIHLVDGGAEVWSVELSGIPGSSAAVADIDANGDSEILVGTQAGYLHVLDCDGDDVITPAPIDGGASTPFVADLTADGCSEVIVCSPGGAVHALSFAGDPAGGLDWAGLGARATRTGVHKQPLHGEIEADLLLAGDFVVTDDVIVSASAALELAPETTLEFCAAGEPALKIFGTLTALGAPAREIDFRSLKADARGLWGGVALEPGATATLRRCRISGARTGVAAQQASAAIDDCEIEGNFTNASFESSLLEAHGVSFSRADSLGLYIDGGSGTVSCCLIESNARAGLECRSTSGYTFVGSTFTGTLAGDGAGFYHNANVVVDSCTFAANAGHGAYVNTSSPSFQNCSFTGNNLNGIHATRLSLPAVGRCTISGNAVGVYCEGGSWPNLGDGINPASGFNSILGNYVAAAANYTSEYAPISAKMNWWGGTPPPDKLFIGRVAYVPYLMCPPSGLRPLPGLDEHAHAFGLEQNAPNPFNATTSITFHVPDGGGLVELSVYDPSGRLVATLLRNRCAPGTYTVVWDGRDDAGKDVASGVYYARMSAAGFSSTRKLLLLK